MWVGLPPPAPIHARLAQRKSATPTQQRSRYLNSRRAPSRRPQLSSLAPLRHGGERGSIPRGRTNCGSTQLDCTSRRNSKTRKRVREARAAADNRVVGGAVPPACTKSGREALNPNGEGADFNP